MLRIVFKNMKQSTLVKNFVEEKANVFVNKFPILKDHNIVLTLEMENSPQQPGPDFFSASSMIWGKKFKDLKIKKSSQNLYQATSLLLEELDEHISKLSRKMNRNRKIAS